MKPKAEDGQDWRPEGGGLKAPGSHRPGSLGRKRLLTVAELAEYLGLPKSWIYDRTRKNGPERIPHVRLGKYVRFELEAVERFLDQHKTGFKGEVGA